MCSLPFTAAAMWALRARACLTVLVTASATMKVALASISAGYRSSGRST
jgi:hypothetical protein